MADDTELIDGGDLAPVDEARPTEGKARPLEDTRARLAFCLVAILAGTIVILLALLGCGELDESEFANVAGVLISPLVGLVGAVTGYYYGKSDR